jgi:hypothetical protein
VVFRTLALLGIAAFLLTGCEPPPVYGPSPTPTVAPIFDSEEEAVEAAQATLSAYVKASNLMGQSGGTDLSGFEGILSTKQMVDEAEYAAALVAAGKRTTGEFAVISFELQQFDDINPSDTFLQAYVCLDASQIAFVDGQGNDLSVEGHASAVPEEFIFRATAESGFVVEEVRKWTGRDFCQQG